MPVEDIDPHFEWSPGIGWSLPLGRSAGVSYLSKPSDEAQPINIWLVEELQIDQLENKYSDARSYAIRGYVTNPNSVPAEVITGTGWPILKGMSEPRYRITALEPFAGSKQQEDKQKLPYCTCPHHGKWYNAEDIDAKVRVLDIAMNGADAARQPLLCDIFEQLMQVIETFTQAKKSQAILLAEINNLQARIAELER